MVLHEIAAGVFYNDTLKRIVTIGYVCPLCRCVVEASFMATCENEKCRLFGQAFRKERIITILR